MGWKKVVGFIILSSVLFSCKNYYHHINGGYRPKKAKFSLVNKNYQSNDNNNPIDTESIYTSIDTLVYGSGEYRSVFFLKFYRNGQSFQSSLNPKINLSQQKISPTYIGYYTVNKEEITMETFYVKHKEKGAYVKEYGVLKNDTIFMYKSSIKDDKFQKPNRKNSTVYIKKKIIKRFPKPDW